MKTNVDSILAPFINQPAMHTDTHVVTLRNGQKASISDSHFGVQGITSTYNMITDARLTTAEVIDRVVRANKELVKEENAALLGEVIARIEELRQPKEYKGTVEHFSL